MSEVPKVIFPPTGNNEVTSPISNNAIQALGPTSSYQSIRPPNWSKAIFVHDRIKPLQLGKYSLLRLPLIWHLNSVWRKLPSSSVSWTEIIHDGHGDYLCQNKSALVHPSGKLVTTPCNISSLGSCSKIINQYRACSANGYLNGIDTRGVKYGN